MVFPNYFETEPPTPIENNMTMNATNSTQQYSLSSEPLEFISNNSLVNEEMLPFVENISSSATPILNEKLLNQFSCKAGDCNKTYATISGLNNHIRK